MGLHGELWQVAASDAKLGGGESARLTDALDANEELRAELTYLLRHLSANLGGEFLRAFVDLLEDQPVHRRPAALVMPALGEVLVKARPSSRGDTSDD